MPKFPVRSFEALAARFAVRHHLDRADQEALTALPYKIRTYEIGQYLLREGDRPTSCSILAGGYIYRQKVVHNGGRQIVAIHMMGDIVDGQNLLLDVADHNIQTLTAATLFQIERENLMELAFDRPRIGRALWFETLVEAALFREWVVNVGRRSARGRVAHMLCEMALRCEAAGICERGSFELPMTQEQLGDVLGLTSVHINRTFKTLAADGLIARRNRSITIADWDRLSSVADFSSGYLHLDEHPDTRARDWRSFKEPAIDRIELG